MYSNIGSKIKGLAQAIFFIEAIAGVIAGIALIASDMALIGFLVMIVLPLVAWISSWLLYGFGEIIDKLRDIEINTNTGYKKMKKSQERETDEFVLAENLDENQTPQRICPRCSGHHDFDYPACPKCNYKYKF